MKRTTIRAVLLGIGLSTLLVGETMANTITVAFGGVTGAAGNATFTYNASLDNGTVDNTSPAHIVIYDFAGFIAGSQNVVPGWVASSQLSGGTSPGIDLAIGILNGDDPTLPNLIWTYTGAPITATGTTLIPLGAFTARSTFNLTKVDYYGSVDRGIDPPLASGSLGPTQVPTAPTVPDGGTSSVLLGMAMLGIETLRRKFLRK